MSKQTKYNVNKKGLKGKVKGKDINDLNGFEIKPKNSYAKKDVLEVKRINIFKPNLIEDLLTKKIYLKMEKIVEQIDDNEDPSPSDLKLILDDVERIRSIIRNEYAKHMSEEKIAELLNKTNYLLQEIGIKAIEKEDIILRNSKEVEESKSR